jgi:urocanate hydratase
MRQSEDTLQERTLRTFTILQHLRPDWGGALIVSCGLTPEGAALALASNIAGAVSLSIEPNPDTLKEALHAGACDFVVNTLDEALRAMKNEVRKHLPLSVGLQGNPAAVLAELLERGVLPQLFTAIASGAGDTDIATYVEAAQAFHSQGTLLVDFDRTLKLVSTAIDANDRLQSFMAQHNFSLESFSFDSATALRGFDARVLGLIPEGDLRRRWVVAAPRHFRRSRFTNSGSYRRTLLLTPQEHELLTHNL